MQLVTSLTMHTSELHKLLDLWDEASDPRNPFAAVLVTPLFASPLTLRLIREELKEKRGSTIYFDSGGYYVQQNKITFEELYCALRDWYRDPENQWADWYVLPDHVPTSEDSPEIVEQKVNETVAAARMFLVEMPSAIQERALPVIQGHTFDQVNRCLEAYLDLGVTYVGFGSFGTSGSDTSINIPDRRSASIVTHLSQQLTSSGILLHTFGISTPPAIYAFKRMGFFSFDSSGWLRSAGYGKVFLPFTRAYNVSHRTIRNGALTQEEFLYLKEWTGHDCPFCQDFHQVRERRFYRSLHNLVVLMETATASEDTLSQKDIVSLISTWSPRYYRMFEEIYHG